MHKQQSERSGSGRLWHISMIKTAMLMSKALDSALLHSIVMLIKL